MSDATIIYLAAIGLVPLLIIVLTIVFSALHVRRERKAGGGHVPLSPATTGYSVGMKFLSTAMFLIVLGLCLLQSVWFLAGSNPTSKTYKLTTKIYGVQVTPSRTVKETTGDTSAAGLPALAIFALPMLSLCVRDWGTRFGKPNQDELMVAAVFGLAGGLSFYRRKMKAAAIKCALLIVCAVACMFWEALGPFIFYLIIPLVMSWFRDIMSAARGVAA